MRHCVWQITTFWAMKINRKNELEQRNRKMEIREWALVDNVNWTRASGLVRRLSEQYVRAQYVFSQNGEIGLWDRTETIFISLF